MVARPTENPGESNKLTLPRLIRDLTDRRKAAKDRERILTENERAKEKMSDIARRLRTTLDDPKFMDQEKNRYSHFPGIEPGIGYSVNTERNIKTGSAYMVEVYARPMDSENYTTGKDDGYWRIYFHRLEWSNTSLHGDLYLGPETAEIIDDVSVDRLSTRVSLTGVDFGGYPSAHLTLHAFEKDLKSGVFIGPIGKLQEVDVLGISRAMKVTQDHLADTESLTIKIGDNFEREGIHFTFPRGEMEFTAKKQVGASGQEILVFNFSGDRQRLAGIRSNQRLIDNLGPETKTVAVPMNLADGHKVINLFENCANNLIAAFRQRE